MKIRKFGTGILLILISLRASPGADIPAELGLSRALEIALQVHPALRAAASRVDGAGGLARQAGLYPNPSLNLQTENWRFGGRPGFEPFQELDLFAYLSQTIERGGKRARRVEAADHDVRVAGLEKKVLEWGIRGEVSRSFLLALLSRREIEIMEESGRYFDQIVEYHRTRVQQGAMAEGDLIRVSVEREKWSITTEMARTGGDRARVALIEAMGASDFPPAFRPVDEPEPPPRRRIQDAAELRERTRSSRPDLELARARLERARAEAELQKALAKPDWSVLLGYKRTTGYDTLLAGLSIPLPFFDRNQGAILQSTADIPNREFLLQAALSHAHAEVDKALAGVRRSQRMLRRMESGMLERAEESFQIALAAYREGGTDLLRLLDAQRLRNEVQMLHLRTQMELRIARAELEHAMGEESLEISEEMLNAIP